MNCDNDDLDSQADCVDYVDYSNSSENDFVRMKIEFDGPSEVLSGSLIQVDYPCWDALGAVPTPPAPPLNGLARVWKKAGSQQRDPQSADTGGAYIDGEHNSAPCEYTTQQMEISDGGENNFWIEGIEAGPLSIEMSMDPDGAGPVGFVFQDEVNATMRPRTIILDPGHGVGTAGNSCLTGLSTARLPAPYSLVNERDGNFLLAQKIRAAVEYLTDVLVVYTKDSASDNLSLLDRARQAGQNDAEILLSLHFDNNSMLSERNTFAIILPVDHEEDIDCNPTIPGVQEHSFRTNNLNQNDENAFAQDLVDAVVEEIGSQPHATPVWSTGDAANKGVLFETGYKWDGSLNTLHPQNYDERLYYDYLPDLPSNDYPWRVKAVLLEVDNWAVRDADLYFNTEATGGTPGETKEDVYESLAEILAEVIVNHLY